MGTSIVVVVGLAIFSAWFLITIMCQFSTHPLGRILKRLDYFGLIPAWTFFAPQPAVQDFTLLYRDMESSGRITPWMVFTYDPPSPIIRWLWNPAKRRPKVIHDMATLWLGAVTNDPTDRVFSLSIPYLCLLHQVAVIPRSKTTTATQLAIGSVFGREPNKPAQIFVVSPFHRL